MDKFVQIALQEDIGSGDHTSLATIPETATGKAQVLVKDTGIVAGVTFAREIWSRIDTTLNVTTLKQDGESIVAGDKLFILSGNIRSILLSERLVLNSLQRMSGVATATNRLVNLVKSTGVKILDTRKTTPNFRLPEKWAVLIGGGHNHRLGLFDMVMLKDNHIDACGGIVRAIQSAKEYLRAQKLDLKIEVETRNLDEVKEAINEGGIDTIMLDNMDIPTLRKAVELVKGRCLLEASGGITEASIRDIAETGVDFISVGAITHSARSIDLSLKIIQ